jgi:hypothetical protein
MTRKRYLIPIITMLVLLTWALQTPAADQVPGEPTTQSELTGGELAALAGGEPPQTLEEKLLNAVEDVDDTVVVRSVDGRTVLMMEGDPEDEFTLSFSSVAEGVRAHVKLGKGGLKHRFTLVKPEGHDDSPIYLDLQGPAVNGGYGVKVTLRF